MENFLLCVHWLFVTRCVRHQLSLITKYNYSTGHFFQINVTSLFVYFACDSEPEHRADTLLNFWHPSCGFWVCARRSCPFTIFRGYFLTFWRDFRNWLLIQACRQLSIDFLHLRFPWRLKGMLANVYEFSIPHQQMSQGVFNLEALEGNGQLSLLSTLASLLCLCLFPPVSIGSTVLMGSRI